MDTKTGLGRPRKDGSSDFYSSPLYQLMLEKLPSEHIKMGRIDTDSLSQATGNVRFSVYRWFRSGSLSPKAVKALVQVSENAADPKKRGALTKQDLIPFISGL